MVHGLACSMELWMHWEVGRTRKKRNGPSTRYEFSYTIVILACAVKLFERDTTLVYNSMVNVEKLFLHACKFNHMYQDDNRIRQIVSCWSALRVARGTLDFLVLSQLSSLPKPKFGTFLHWCRRICDRRFIFPGSATLENHVFWLANERSRFLQYGLFIDLFEKWLPFNYSFIFS